MKKPRQRRRAPARRVVRPKVKHQVHRIRSSRIHHSRAAAAGVPQTLRTIVEFPFRLVGRVLLHIIQAVLSIFIGILHPSFKWLSRLLLRSTLVRNYIRPAVQAIAARLYEPYFAWLRSLPPFWATISIAVPLAVLEPAKAYATILIATRPKIGILLWLALQGLSVVLIEETWTAVRPQARKIWLVSRLHAWGWLMVSHGKYWITSSPAYQTMLRWSRQIRAAAQRLWWQVTMSPRRRQA